MESKSFGCLLSPCLSKDILKLGSTIFDLWQAVALAYLSHKKMAAVVVRRNVGLLAFPFAFSPAEQTLVIQLDRRVVFRWALSHKALISKAIKPSRVTLLSWDGVKKANAQSR